MFPLNITSSLSSDSSRSFYWMTDASPSPVLSLFQLRLNPSLSSDSSRSFYWMTDASPSLVLSLFCSTSAQVCRPTAVALSTG
ncbi:hypothetical protein BDR07DRAFT_1611457 [Suillus spraguei]|nr:hypothetical protein BDR07DRAFT_1611457 [Suillus spraguei]